MAESRSAADNGWVSFADRLEDEVSVVVLRFRPRDEAMALSDEVTLDAATPTRLTRGDGTC